jgi:hypothetical protein
MVTITRQDVHAVLLELGFDIGSFPDWISARREDDDGVIQLMVRESEPDGPWLLSARGRGWYATGLCGTAEELRRTVKALIPRSPPAPVTRISHVLFTCASGVVLLAMVAGCTPAPGAAEPAAVEVAPADSSIGIGWVDRRFHYTPAP